MELAWESFKAGSLLIAALIVNAAGDVVAIGRNQMFESAMKNS